MLCQPRAEEQPPTQPESSLGTLDFTVPMHRREHSSAVQDRPWGQALFVEERHVVTEPLLPGTDQDIPHASPEAWLHKQQQLQEEWHGSNSLSGMDERGRHPPGEQVLDQLQQDCQGDLAASLKATVAHTPQVSWQGYGKLNPLPLDLASGVGAASDSAGPEVIPDTVQKQDAASDDRPEGAHELHSSGKKQDPRFRRNFIPDSLDKNDYHLQPSSAQRGLQDMRYAQPQAAAPRCQCHAGQPQLHEGIQQLPS